MYLFPTPPAFLVTHTLDRFTRGFFDDTFAGIHQLSWFDWALLIPYFGILAVLSVYGMHRFETIRTYFKYRKKAMQETSIGFGQLPPVTIQLPLYNERYVLERLIDETVKMEYPRELLQIQVLDGSDSTDDTHDFADALCEKYRNMGHNIQYLHRTNREGFKAVAGAARRAEIGYRRAGGGLRCGFHSARRLSYAHNSPLRRFKSRRGADALELFESRLQLPHRSGRHAVGRPFYSRARRPLACGSVLQFQRNRRHSAGFR